MIKIIIKNPIFVDIPILENKFLVHANILIFAIFFISLILANNLSLSIYLLAKDLGDSCLSQEQFTFIIV